MLFEQTNLSHLFQLGNHSFCTILHEFRHGDLSYTWTCNKYQLFNIRFTFKTFKTPCLTFKHLFFATTSSTTHSFALYCRDRRHPHIPHTTTSTNFNHVPPTTDDLPTTCLKFSSTWQWHWVVVQCVRVSHVLYVLYNLTFVHVFVRSCSCPCVYWYRIITMFFNGFVKIDVSHKVMTGHDYFNTWYLLYSLVISGGACYKWVSSKRV